MAAQWLYTSFLYINLVHFHVICKNYGVSVQKKFGDVRFFCNFAFGKFLAMAEVLINQLSNYFSTQPVERAWLFGSFARGEQTPKSDVDILVSFDKKKPVGLFAMGGMYMDLKRLLGRDIDLVEEGSLLPFAVESANRDKILIYERGKA